MNQPCDDQLRATAEAGYGDRIERGKGTAADLKLIDQLSETLRLTSICGLGQFAPAPIASVLKHFREEVEAHIVSRRCPTIVCPMSEVSV